MDWQSTNHSLFRGPRVACITSNASIVSYVATISIRVLSTTRLASQAVVRLCASGTLKARKLKVSDSDVKLRGTANHRKYHCGAGNFSRPSNFCIFKNLRPTAKIYLQIFLCLIDCLYTGYKKKNFITKENAKILLARIFIFPSIPSKIKIK